MIDSAMTDSLLSSVCLLPNEALLIADACTGLLLVPSTLTLSVELLWNEILVSARIDGLCQKWDLHGPELVKRLRLLTADQVRAVLLAIGVAWEMVDAGDERDMRVILRDVGLV